VQNNTIKLAVITALATPLAINSALVSADEIEHLQVWGTKVKSSSVYVSDQDIAAKQVDHLSDLLRNIPGVDVGGTHSLNQRINVRGLDDTDLEVLIDGASQNNYMFHHMGNLLINPDILESVDIQVGSNSVVHSGLGGAVEFRTKSAKSLLRDDETIGGRVLLGYNDNDSTYATFTGFAQLSDNIDALVYGSTMQRDNFEDGDGVLVLGSEGDIVNAMFKLGWDITNEQRLSLKIDSYEDHGDYNARPDMGVRTDRAIGGGEVPLYDTRYERDTVSLHYELDFGDAISLRADLFRNENVLWREFNEFVTEGESINTGLTLIANSIWRNHHAFGKKHTFTYGVKWINSDSDSIDTDGTSLSVGGEETDDLRVFVEDRIEFASGLALTPGLRYNRYEKSSTVRPEKDTWNDVQTALAADYRVNDQLTIIASFTELFKGPQPGEIFINEQAGKTYNPDLEPETGDNVEYGFRYQAGNVLGADELRVALTVFESTIDDYIEPVDFPNDDCVGRGCIEWDQNIGKVEIDGFESSIRYAVGAFDALLTYANSDSEIISANTIEPLEREVGDSAGLTLNYFVEQYDLALTWYWQKVFSEGEKAAYQVHDFTAVWEPQHINGLTATLGLENLFDETYVSHASRTGTTVHPRFGDLQLDDFEPGRNIKLSLAYHF